MPITNKVKSIEFTKGLTVVRILEKLIVAIVAVLVDFLMV
jgi:hypothetical protein